jgi:GDP-mannose 6-dehydrogenase
MNIAVFGMGYVGCVTAACLAESGHNVIGVDVSADKVATINAGKSPIVEDRIEDMLTQAVSRGALRASMDAALAIRETELSLVCVGTPSQANGSLDLSAVLAVSEQIGGLLKGKDSYHCVVFRSTVLPGTVRTVLIPALEAASGKRANVDFDVCMNPEFLREGSSVADFYHPPFVIIGAETARGGDAVARMYAGIEAPMERTSYEVSELVKYACNNFHALKVTFANEIGALCKGLGIDSHRVMQLFTMDRKLNVSPAYLKPGFAFGGPCLPKDLRAVLHKARELDVPVPLLTSVLESNRVQMERVVERILATRDKRVGVLGLSFKPGTDDLRESPIVSLIETLVGKGCQVKVYDPDVLLSRIFGANKRFIDRELPHIGALLAADIDDVLSVSEVIVVAKPSSEFATALTPHVGNKTIFDLVRLPLPEAVGRHRYEGISW